ncbi:MAG: hypothetical protein K6B65_07100 [Bacilli bacterium]|nr:hypothetical protein [Bacilli bacterium]
MPKCKYCNKEIQRFDADICPYCGQPDPIPKDYRTMDVTKTILKLDVDGDSLYRSKSRKQYILLCMLLGWTGAHDFYIVRNNLGFIDILISVIVIGGLGSGLCFGTPLSFFGYLIAFGVVFLGFFAYSFVLRLKDSPRDGNGEFLR